MKSKGNILLQLCCYATLLGLAVLGRRAVHVEGTGRRTLVTCAVCLSESERMDCLSPLIKPMSCAFPQAKWLYSLVEYLTDWHASPDKVTSQRP